MGQHYKKVCLVHRDVITQCRCASPSKFTDFVECPGASCPGVKREQAEQAAAQAGESMPPIPTLTTTVRQLLLDMEDSTPAATTTTGTARHTAG